MRIEIVTMRLDPAAGAAVEVPRSPGAGPVERVDPLLFEWDGAPHVALVVTSLTSVTSEGPAVTAARPARAPVIDYRERLREAEQPIFDALWSWRGDRAVAEGVSSYLVLSNRTLAEIAATRPRTADELAATHGVGPIKLERYAEEVLALVGSFDEAA